MLYGYIQHHFKSYNTVNETYESIHKTHKIYMITKITDRCGSIVKDKVSNELLYINDLAARYNLDGVVMTYTQLKWLMIKSIENRIKND